MKIGSLVLHGAYRVRRIPELSREANARLMWFDFYEAWGHNAQLTCRHFAISRQTFYRWKKRYDPYSLKTLESSSHRPKRLRQPTATAELERAVLELREQYPRWGKDKLVVLLHRQDFGVSTSMVGRILKRLKDRGILKEPRLNSISARKRQLKRPYAVRKPKDYVACAPGDIVQVDTLDIRPLPGIIIKHSTARDTVSKWDVLEAHTRASAAASAKFLNRIIEQMPFPVRAIQVDGGSEFQDVFEAECQRRGIKLFVLPPRSPKLNGHVERAQRTHTEEFYEVTDSCFEITGLNKALLEWARVYNTIRPHQALGYLTPQEFLECYKESRGKEVMCH